jgi:hypothetical protein
MMKIVVSEGNDLAFTAQVFGLPRRDIIEYHAQQTKDMVTDLRARGHRYSNNVEDLYSLYNSAEAIQNAKRILSTLSNQVDDTAIYVIDTLERLAKPNIAMKNWIALEPEINRLTKINMVDGFEEFYDKEPDTEPYHRSDVLDVLSGMQSTDGYYGNYTDGIDQYYHSEWAFNPDERLDDIDKESIYRTWDMARLALAKGLDPTNKCRIR